MGFVQKDDILIVLDETQLDYAIFVLPKHRHFKFGLFDVAVAFGAKSYKTNRDMMSEVLTFQERGGIQRGNKVAIRNYKLLKVSDL